MVVQAGCIGTIHPTKPWLQVVSVLNGFKVIVGSARITAENVRGNFFPIIIVGLAVLIKKMPLSLVIFWLFRKTKGHKMLLSYIFTLFFA